MTDIQMRKILFSVALILCAAPLLAQGGGGPPGGGGGMGGPPGGGPPGGDRPSKPREMKPIKRAALDKAVTAMFREADANGDGMVTIQELRSVIQARRDDIIRKRFAAIDKDRNGAISPDEFLAWQNQMGSVASTDAGATGDRDGPIAEMIRPHVGDDPEDGILAHLIQPIDVALIAQANSNYDAGLSLDELLAHERARFDAADIDKDGELSPDEMRRLMPRDNRPGGGPPPMGGNGPPPR
jgi:Ca2+-binding EF-hand superfamily protein